MRVSGEFEEYHRRVLGGEFDDFMGSLAGRSGRASVRVNSLKVSVGVVGGLFERERVEFAGVPWCDVGLWVSADVPLPEFEHQLGWFFVQDAGSMIPPVVLDVAPGLSVLDLCAAPGAKATQVAADLDNRGVLVVNEPDYRRIRALVYNVQRCGVSNAVVTKHDGCGFHELGLEFDRVLVDAPCSGVGTAGRNREVLSEWSLGRVKRFSGLQRRLVDSAFRCLKVGGVMVYSTCTTSVEENEGVVEHLLRNHGDACVEKVRLPGLVWRRGLSPETRNCLRVYSHLNGTGTYFIAKVRKNE
jgi:NOL1/NOP2/sun family putative RNA methylase